MSLLENVLYGMKRRDKDKALELLRLVGLENLAKEKPQRLSGGQKQRVALARALAREPKVLLLDEPLSALDPRTRLALRDELKQLQRQSGVPTLMVSHDIEEVLHLADRVISIEKGRKLQEGKPLQVLFNNPSEGLVALRALVTGSFLKEGKRVFVLELKGESLRLELQNSQDLKVGDEVILYLKSVGLEFNQNLTKKV